MATPSYTNDTHPDIAYLLVFNYISLQERVRLRIVCQRWKSIIEDDCAQMTNLCLFEDEDDLVCYIEKTQHRKVMPLTAKDASKHDPTRWNTIIILHMLKPRIDVSFFVRLFPAIQNLALAWSFDKTKDLKTTRKTAKKSKKTVRKTTKKSKKAMTEEEVIDPDIFGLLIAWAPNLRELYFVAKTFDFKLRSMTRFSVISINNICLEEDRTNVFWQCLALMAPTLQKLVLGRVDLTTAPESLVLPSLEEMTYFNDCLGFYGNLFCTPHRLHELAPILQSVWLSIKYIWDWKLPETVNRLTVVIEKKPVITKIVPCPSITHLGVEFRDCHYTVSGYPTYLFKKFPNIKSLAVIEVDKNFPCWLAEKGKEFDSVGFLSALARHQPGPLGGIEELFLCSFTDYHWFLSNKSSNAKDGFDVIFRGIAATFRGLKKLTLAIGWDTEEGHRNDHLMFTELKGRYLPAVELDFTLDLEKEDEMRVLAFQSGSANARTNANECFLAPGCAFVRQADAEPSEMPNLNKKQRTK